MDESWACSAAYVYVLHLDPGSRAWEYLRRNPRYVHDWIRYRRRPSHRIAARWGLSSLVDPRLGARETSPIWMIRDLAPVTLVRYDLTPPRKSTAAAERFSIWHLAGRKSLYEDVHGLWLVAGTRSRKVRLRVGGDLDDGAHLAFQIPVVGDDRATWTAVVGFRALVHAPGNSGDASNPPLERPDRSDVFHARALQVLDGLAAGASQRELAKAIFGSAAAAGGWQPDGALRAQLRYLVRRSKALMEDEYRSLVCMAAEAGGRLR
jgi:hypothetical protein